MNTANSATMCRKELRNFGLILGSGLALFFGLLLPWLGNWQWQSWPWFTAGTLLVISLVAPGVLKPAYLAWMKIGNVLSWINTRIILALLFFIIFLPISIILRLLGKDPMARKLDTKATSYRIPSRHPDVNKMENPF